MKRAFTLIELILVMALLTIAVSTTAPTLSRFFRGRTLEAEARRLLALTHIGQSRAVSEGVPVNLWVDPEEGSFGLEAEPSYEENDPKAIIKSIDPGLQIEAITRTLVATNTMTRVLGSSTVSVPKAQLIHPTLPTIRFLPDGSISDSSPQSLRLIGRDGESLWLAQTRNRLNYEIRTTDK
jgi:prepilin-type N-terminal cleavage/methylation domain-containing protein